MERRAFFSRLLTLGAAVAAAAIPVGEAGATRVRVRYGVARWIRHHRRYLHHHLPRRRRR